MKFENIITEVKGKVFYVTLNRPEKLNALSNALMKELDIALDKAEDNNVVRRLQYQSEKLSLTVGAGSEPAPTNFKYLWLVL
jgi:enoyl-CoA hydratase/carnithine racemase